MSRIAFPSVKIGPVKLSTVRLTVRLWRRFAAIDASGHSLEALGEVQQPGMRLGGARLTGEAPQPDCGIAQLVGVPLQLAIDHLLSPNRGMTIFR
jgi:hypothetical protein